jgi:hypothetical protein
MYEDAALPSKIYLGGPVVLCDAVTSKYRQHEGSACAKARATGEYRPGWLNPARQTYLEWLEAYVKEVGVNDARLDAAIACGLKPYRSGRKAPARQAVASAAHTARDLAPDGVRHRVGAARRRLTGVGVGAVGFGSLRRTEPISRDFGFVRGGPVDRYYIEGFLSRHAGDIAGRVLEIGDDTYTRRFGGGAVTQAMCSTSMTATRSPPSSATWPTPNCCPRTPSTASC